MIEGRAAIQIGGAVSGTEWTEPGQGATASVEASAVHADRRLQLLDEAVTAGDQRSASEICDEIDGLTQGLLTCPCRVMKKNGK